MSFVTKAANGLSHHVCVTKYNGNVLKLLFSSLLHDFIWNSTERIRGAYLGSGRGRGLVTSEKFPKIIFKALAFALIRIAWSYGRRKYSCHSNKNLRQQILFTLLYLAILKPRGLRQSGSSLHLGKG